MKNDVVKKALKVMESEAKNTGVFLSASQKAKDYCRLNLGLEKEEVFMCIFLNNQNELIACEKLFRGTINEASVYIRVILRKVIEHNAANIILSHNHLSGTTKPSEDDKKITKKIQYVLDHVDCKVVDHIIVTAKESFSFCENNILDYKFEEIK